MSSAATVPIIGPDGATYDIPHDRVSDAVAQGGKLAMDIIGPDKTYAVPLDNVHDALSNGGTLKPPAMPAAPIPQALQPTPTLQQAASMQDLAQRYAALRQRMQEDATPIAQSAQAAVPTMPVSQAVSALPNAGTLLARAEEAGKVFQALDQQIGDHVVDVTKVGDVALDAADWASHGGQRIKQISNFLRRVTAPDADPLTYPEARQLLSNAGLRLTLQEMQKMAPQAQRYLSQFASSLDDAIRSTAEDAGVLDDYTNVVDEYREAMKLNDAWEAVKEQGVRILKYAIPGAATAYAIKSAVSR